MIDSNGVYTPLTFNEALEIVLEIADNLGVSIPPGSAEEQISLLLAQWLLGIDNNIGKTIAIQLRPTGSNIDLQHPGTPRLLAQTSSGFLRVTNPTVNPIEIQLNRIATSINGNQYTTGNNTIVVPAMGTADITVISVLTGINQNLPSNQAFTFSDYPDLTAVNPQPFVNGRDLETDTEYLSRIIYLQTNNTSQQATPAAIKELLDFYPAALIYVNNTANTLPLPVETPPNGYIAVVQFPSGASASAAEMNNAFLILSRRFEFSNAFKNATVFHPVKSATIYTGPFPQTFYLLPAQAVKTTINAEITVAFAPNTDEEEKKIQANAFGGFFAQNLTDFFGGASGNVDINFVSLVNYGDVTSIPVSAARGAIDKIAPAISIEQVRALISDVSQIVQLKNMEYRTCDLLTVEFTPDVEYEEAYTLSIDAPDGGTVKTIDFKKTALFSDGSSWFDRYVYLDPALITITIKEA